MKANELSLGWAMTQPDPAAAVQQVRRNWHHYEQLAASRIARAARAALPTIVLALQGTLCVAFCFALMFLAAIIGG